MKRHRIEAETSVESPPPCLLFDKLCINEILHILEFLAARFWFGDHNLFVTLCQVCKDMNDRRSAMSRLFCFVIKDTANMRVNLQGLSPFKIEFDYNKGTLLTNEDIVFLNEIRVQRLTLRTTTPECLHLLTYVTEFESWQFVKNDLPPNILQFIGRCELKSSVSVNSSLTYLDLQNTRSSEWNYLEAISIKFPNLIVLKLVIGRLRIAQAPVTDLFAKLNLREFSINGSKSIENQTDDFVKKLAPTVQPFKLYLSCVVDVGIVSRFTNLQSLTLADLKTATSLEKLAGLECLEHLTITSGDFLEKVTLWLPKLTSAKFINLPKLESVQLSDSKNLTSLLLRNLPVLQPVWLHDDCSLRANQLTVERCPKILFRAS
jgi:hypothetical protein